MYVETTTHINDTNRHWQAMAGIGLNVNLHGAMKVMMQISMCT